MIPFTGSFIKPGGPERLDAFLYTPVAGWLSLRFAWSSMILDMIGDLVRFYVHGYNCGVLLFSMPAKLV
jgi:hypothetical protein